MGGLIGAGSTLLTERGRFKREITELDRAACRQPRRMSDTEPQTAAGKAPDDQFTSHGMPSLRTACLHFAQFAEYAK
ncbi:MAG TPA: hypothetical protein VH008_02885 [Pseudonocardia sp.]|nr:hypothetical protein [Pseudonocardia sp.]